MFFLGGQGGVGFKMSQLFLVWKSFTQVLFSAEEEVEREEGEKEEAAGLEGRMTSLPAAPTVRLKIKKQQNKELTAANRGR